MHSSAWILVSKLGGIMHSDRPCLTRRLCGLQSLSEKWVERATRPPRSATRRPERDRTTSRKRGFCGFRVSPPFRPASRRTGQASGLCHPKPGFRTSSRDAAAISRRLLRIIAGCLAVLSVGVARSASPPVSEVIIEEYFDTQSDWYDQNQVQQVRQGWTLWNATGSNPLGNPHGTEPWNDWALPEAIFRWNAFLPPHEWPDLLNERGYSYKIFAGNRAWHVRLSSLELILGPGEYRVTLKFYCDTYTWDGRKVPPSTPVAFESKLNLGSQEGPWNGSRHLASNTLTNHFTVVTPEAGFASFELRGRWALNNVGAFVHWFKVERFGSSLNQPPTARFGHQSNAGPPPRPVTFDAGASTDPDGDALLVQWDFGDGDTGGGTPITHTFLTAGRHTVTCTVLDGKGGVDATSAEVEIPRPFGWSDNLIVNGDFSGGWNGWQTWLERGALTPASRHGGVELKSGNHNGGIYQSFDTGGPGTVILVDGVWAAVHPNPNQQWAEILILNSARTPVAGQDIRAEDPDVVLLYKNDTWVTPAGWRGFCSDSAPVRRQTSFIAAGPKATIVLKSGNLGGASTGTFYDDLLVRPASLPQDSDRDGLDDQWELTHFRHLNQEGWQDPDGDQLTNHEEWQADTAPANPLSVLRLIGLEMESPQIRVRWQGGTSARQIVEQRSWTNPPVWTSVFTNQPPTPLTNSVFLDLQGPGGCLRIRAGR